MSVLVTLELPAKAETLDEFMAVMRDTLLATRAYAGCEKVETYLEQNTSTLFLVERWEIVPVAQQVRVLVAQASSESCR